MSSSLPIYKLELLETIKDMLDDNRMAMKCYESSSDYLDGSNTALKELAVKLNLCEYRELED